MSSAHPEANKMELNKNKIMNFFMGKGSDYGFSDSIKASLRMAHYRTLSGIANIVVSVGIATKQMCCG